MRVSLRALALPLAAGMLLSAPARAEFPSEVPDRAQLGISSMFGVFDTGVAVGPSNGPVNLMIVLEDALDLDVHDTFVTTDGFWRFGGRHYLDVGYLNVERKAHQTVDEQFDFGRYTFHAGAQADGWFASRFAYAAYRYDFLQLEPVRISGSAGMSIGRLDGGVSATGNITDRNNNVVNGQTTVESKYTVPLPLLGFQLDWALTPRSVLEAYNRTIWVDFSTLRGGMSDVVFRYHWFFVPHAAVGIGYERLNVSLPKYVTEGQVQRFAYTVQGLTLYLRGAY